MEPLDRTGNRTLTDILASHFDSIFGKYTVYGWFIREKLIRESCAMNGDIERKTAMGKEFWLWVS